MPTVWASASDIVSIVVGTAKPNAAPSPRRENAPRREIISDVILSRMPLSRCCETALVTEDRYGSRRSKYRRSDIDLGQGRYLSITIRSLRIIRSLLRMEARTSDSPILFPAPDHIALNLKISRKNRSVRHDRIMFCCRTMLQQKSGLTQIKSIRSSRCYCVFGLLGGC